MGPTSVTASWLHLWVSRGYRALGIDFRPGLLPDGFLQTPKERALSRPDALGINQAESRSALKVSDLAGSTAVPDWPTDALR